MMTTIRSYMRQGAHLLRRLRMDPKFHAAARVCLHILSGFLLSAASLSHTPQPLAMGLVCSLGGIPSLLAALGSVLGYRIFWGDAANQCILWVALGLAAAAGLNRRTLQKTAPLLLPSVAALIVSACGVFFQMRYGETVPIWLYLLRVVLAGGSAWLFSYFQETQDAIARWMVCALAVLALGQIAPAPWLNLGFLAAGALCVAGPFPAAALAGLALDLAQVCPLSITGVLCLAWLCKLSPRVPKAALALSPAAAYLMMVVLGRSFYLYPLASLVLGGIAGVFLPTQSPISRRKGETGTAQVRLEMAAGVFAGAQQALLEAPEIPIDEPALIARAAERACGTCPCRKGCRERESALRLPTVLLHKPLLDQHDLPIACRKSGRFLMELHRSQEQLRSIKAGREQQTEYRRAVMQQYQFLSEYLQDLSDLLGKRLDRRIPRYQPRVSFYANRQRSDNGDRCIHFSGTLCRHYVLLCDGMGTGLGAADEAAAAAGMLKQLLTAGFPAEYALRSLNSLCALRSRAGAVTVDLAELHLDTGKVSLYKWGAAPSYLMSSATTEKIGTAGPPPGISVTDARETVEQLSLRRKQTLILCSDGVDGEVVQRCCLAAPAAPLGELAAQILERGTAGSTDDATLVLIRLFPDSSPIS